MGLTDTIPTIPAIPYPQGIQGINDSQFPRVWGHTHHARGSGGGFRIPGEARPPRRLRASPGTPLSGSSLRRLSDLPRSAPLRARSRVPQPLERAGLACRPRRRTGRRGAPRRPMPRALAGMGGVGRRERRAAASSGCSILSGSRFLRRITDPTPWAPTIRGCSALEARTFQNVRRASTCARRRDRRHRPVLRSLGAHNLTATQETPWIPSAN